MKSESFGPSDRDAEGAAPEARLAASHPTGPPGVDSRGGVQLVLRPPVVRAPRTIPDQLPLSYAQLRLWLIYQMDRDSAANNIPFGIRFRGRLDEDALRRSINEIVRRHEVLRTTFALQDGVPVQKIAAGANFVVSDSDLRSLPVSARESEVGRLARAEAEMPFNLETGPLLRMKLLRITDWEYRLVGSMHHIITDAWSTGVMMLEFTQIYQAMANGKESPLRPLTLQYGDFSVWQRAWLQGEVEREQIEYWKKQLMGVTALELPTDHPRPSVLSERARTVGIRLPGEMVGKLTDLSRTHGVTLFMTLLAGFQVVLSRYTRQFDIPVGIPIANRNSLETERLIGFFVNTLVVRTNLIGSPSFAEVLRSVRLRCLEAYRHQDVPFERLVQILQPQRDAAGNPLFQVMLALQNTAARKLALPGLELEEIVIESSTTQFDLMLFAQPSSAGLECSLVYRAALWEPDSMKRMLGHWEHFLAAIVSDPSQRITDITFLPKAEMDRLLREWNSTEKEYGDIPLVHQRFEARVEQIPDAIAVVYGDARVTYEELNRRANRLANCLRQKGVGPDARVAICLERSPDVVVAILAALKAGGAYVPLDPLYPRDRINFMVRDAQARVLITQTGLLELFVEPLPTIICLDRQWPAMADCGEENPRSVAGPSNLAYVMYTSGSAGKPKGVMMSHGPLSNLLSWQYRELPLGAKTIQFASLSFDVSFQELFSSLTSGQTLVLLSDDVRRDPESIRRVIMKEEADRMFVPCAVLHSILTIGVELPAWSNSLIEVITAGEKLQVTDDLRRAFRHQSAMRLHNHYGPTEAHVVTSFSLPRDPSSWTQYPSIGKPIANAQIYILDSNLLVMPIGVPGELHIGGGCLARGYLDQPGLTAEKFIPNPFSVDPGKRLYKTGDLARWLADGGIEFIGRRDHQVKLRGFRIELGEIEAVLAQHGSVDRAVVMVDEDRPGSKRLVAYLAPKPGVDPAGARDLRDHLKTVLPDYMVPSAFVWLAEFPLTTNGKIDRKQLQLLAPVPKMDEYHAPRTPVEEIVAAVWESVLGLHGIGTTDNFFEIGGHSLLATQVISRVRGIFAVDFSLRTLFESPTVSELARAISAAGKTEVPAIRRAERERRREIPLSFAQERMWFLDQFDPGNVAYYIPMAVRLEGSLSEKALEQALREVIRRHEVLRTVFRPALGRAAQRILETVNLNLALKDLSDGETEAGRLEAAREALRREAARPFDLEKGPLVRALLLRLGPEEHILQVTIHHIVMDGWSMRILVREIGEIYAAQVEDRKPQLPEVTLQYADYAVWQREWLREEVLEQELSYWKSQLRGAQAVEFPPDRRTALELSDRAGCRQRRIPAPILRGLKGLACQEGATLFMVLLAGFQALLFRYTRHEDMTIGSPISGRTRPEIEKLIGFFVNVVALRVRLEGQMAFSELVRRVRESALEAHLHQDLPFEKLVEAMRQERDLNSDPLFKIVFMMQNVPMPDLHWGQLRMNVVEIEAESAKFDLTIVVMEAGDGLMVSAEYRKHLYGSTTVEQMLENYEELLRLAVEDPLRTIEGLSLD